MSQSQPKPPEQNGPAVVTGAAGFIGGAISRRLLASGRRVIGVDRPGTEGRMVALGVEPRLADIRDASALGQALAGAAALFHTAALVREWGPMAEFVEVNVRGTARVLDAAEAAGVERTVVLSSVAVAGYEFSGRQDERAPLRAVGSPYLDTKAAGERLARRRGAVVVRPGDVVGPGSIPWVVRPLELGGRGMLAVPRGEPRMLPVWIDDLAEAVLLAELRGRTGEAYNVWSGEELSFGDYFDRLLAAAGPPGAKPARRLPGALLRLSGRASRALAELRGIEPPFTEAAVTYVSRRGTLSAERARGELGWAPRVGLDEALERIATERVAAARLAPVST